MTWAFGLVVALCLGALPLRAEKDSEEEARKKFDEMLQSAGETVKDFREQRAAGTLKASPGDIFEAAMCGDLAELEKILKADRQKANSKAEDGATPLHRAVNFDQKKAIGMLVHYGANVNARGPDEATPVLDAASNGEAKIIAFLVSKGADLALADEAGYTPLHWAAQKGHLEAIKVLLKAGANKDAKDGRGRIPADLADLMEKPEAAKLLR